MRQSTSRRPDLFIVGFPKCATTSLYEYLRGHPDIFMSPAKEPRYFADPPADSGSHVRDLVYRDDEQRYLKLFAEARGERRVGEATTDYVYVQAAPDRIRDFQPDARIIVMVRNPVEMIQSYHSQLVEEGREEVTAFELAVMPAPTGRREFYIDRAGYARHLPRWFDAFGRDRVHVTVMEDLVADPAGTFAAVLQFLDVDPNYRPDFAVHNTRFATRFPLIRRAGRTRGPQWLIRRALPAVFGDAAVRRVVRKLRHSTLGRTKAQRKPMPASLSTDLQRELQPDVAVLSEMLGSDLANLWWGASTESPG